MSPSLDWKTAKDLGAMIFKTKQEATDHAAYCVALFWLRSASAILRRGEKPMKLSRCGLTLSRDEMDREIYGRWSALMHTHEVCRNAIQIALSMLQAGRFPAVRQHFEVCPNTDETRISTREIEILES